MTCQLRSIQSLGLAFVCLCMFAETTEAQPSRNRGSANIYKTRINPNWIGDGSHFWYRNDLHRGEREFVLVDAKNGERKQAFDQKKLAAALTKAGCVSDPKNLQISMLSFDLESNTIAFAGYGKKWTLDRATYKLSENNEVTENANEGLPALSRMPTRFSTGEETSITFVNRAEQKVEIIWLNPSGRKTSYATLKPGEEHDQHTFAGHVWEVVGEHGKTIAFFQATAAKSKAIVTAEMKPVAGRRQRRRSSRPNRSNLVSPDGNWRAEVREENVFIVDTKSNKKIQLSDDGIKGNGYGRLSWSPDSKALAAFRIERVERKKVYRVNSAIGDRSFRGELQVQSYPLPGDEFSKYEPNIFDITNQTHVKPDVERVDFGTPSFYWHGDHKATYQKVDRGHQRFRLVEIDGLTGDHRNIIDEKSDTFIWTTHMAVMRHSRVKWLEGNQEIIYVSEMDGYRHLFLVDVATGKVKNTITPGEYVVSEVDRIDEGNRQVWFRATGMNKNQDPYFTHYYRIDFDGTNLVELTKGDGTHSIEFGPNRNCYIDTYSRVDMPPVHELRRTSDGELLCELERADVSHSAWKPTTVFVSKARDDKTDIWGIIAFPENYDPNEKYPIIEDIYAGPHDSFTPKSFSPRARYKQFTDLGFVVVKLDGMGTANRSKAFHDVCWHNLKDAGFPDRIKWIKAAAKKYSAMDTSRVGIYGTSAGGQSAAGALLFHGDFYGVAVSSCGCHDNRMDKASWNEQWMGYPVGPHYAKSSNIDNANKLRGKLMLIIGEVDSNVPPASTFKFVDALVRTNKDFELVYLPGVGHSSGGAYGNRKRVEFFRKHLLGEDVNR